MIVDSSAIVGIILREPGAEALLERLQAASERAIAAPTFLEAGIVLAFRLPANGVLLLERFTQALGIEILPFDDEHARVAIDAYDRYGKGRHDAALNFGDCVSYAAAVASGRSLLFKGEDFARTDVEVA